MAFHCTNCNGGMVFDIASQQMKCQHCGSTCDPQDFAFRDLSTQASKADDGLAHFSCQNCGAELEGTEDSLIGFCPYCGGQSIVRDTSSSFEAEGIVPFTVTKEQCMQRYATYAKGVRYLPREMKDPAFLSRFLGIYMPFNQYDTTFGDATVTGSKTVVSNSSYDEVAYYEAEVHVPQTYERGVTYDASKYLDDEISARVQPFNMDRQQPFNPAYLAGFYADTSTVEPSLYYGDAAEQAAINLMEAAGDNLEDNRGITVDANISKISATTVGHHAVLLPLWFLTWRKKDRVAYAVINGESGEVVSDLPLDLRPFALGSVLVSVVAFALLELMVQPTPLITSLVSLAGVACMAWGLAFGARREYERQTHANDKGWGEQDGTEAGVGTPTAEAPATGATNATGANKPTRKLKRRNRKKPEEKKKSKLSFSTVMSALMIAIWCAYAARSVFVLGGTIGNILRFLLPVCVMIYVLYTCWGVWRWREQVARTDLTVCLVALLVTAVLNSAVVVVSPVNDGWYYLADAVCIAGLIVCSIGVIRLYNIGTTRPLPKLFDRKEV